MKRAKKIRLGIFLFVSAALLLILIAYMTAQALFERKDTYYVAYQDVSVSGLEVGSSVKFLGINVGSVTDIRIDPDDVNTIIVELAVKENTPVKEDAVADIISLGITGLKAIEIRGGTQEADLLQEGKYIAQGASLAEDITGQAEVIAYKLELVLNNLHEFTEPENMRAFRETAESITAFAGQASGSLSRIDEVVAENRDDIRQVITAMSGISGELELTADQLSMAISRFNEIMQGDTLGQMLANFRDISITLKENELDALIEGLAVATTETQKLLTQIGHDIDRGAISLTENLHLLEQTLNNLHDISRQVSTNPSVLVRRPRIHNAPDQRLIDP